MEPINEAATTQPTTIPAIAPLDIFEIFVFSSRYWNLLIAVKERSSSMISDDSINNLDSSHVNPFVYAKIINTSQDIENNNSNINNSNNSNNNTISSNSNINNNKNNSGNQQDQLVDS
ncbi:hypothetical protein ACTFIZ_002343 [Dictyostelium cf. discoideum]